MTARIAVVEDDEGVRGLVTEILTGRGFEVVAFASIGEAAAALRSQPPDLLITDIELPDGNGLDLVGMLGEEGARVPTIVLSGLRRESDYVRGFAAGAVDYLAKPFSSEELLARCSIHLARAASSRLKPPTDDGDLPKRNGLVFGRYTIERELGRGGYGQVFLARDRGQGERRVALKVLSSLGAEQQDARLRFIRETYSASGVRHPRIAALYDMGSEQGRVYYAMEFVPGGSLTARVKDGGPLPEVSVRVLARGMLEALEAVRRAGLVHRDLKPDNVILRGGDPAEPVLIDFGLAKRTFDRGITDASMIVGTAAYMPPEAILGRTVDHRSDLFSLGMTLRYAIAGEEVFPDLEGIELLKAIAVGPIPPPRRPLSPIFRAFLGSLTAIDPEKRPTSAQDALTFLEGLPDPAPDDGDRTEEIKRP